MDAPPDYGSHTSDRRKHLHLPIRGVATFVGPEGTVDLPFVELSVGGVFFESEPPWPDGTEVEAVALSLDDQVFELGAVARVAASDDTGRPGFVADLIDLDGPARTSIQAAFSYALSRVMPRPDQAMRFDWAFRDRAQLAEVCGVLLAGVELPDAWTENGPTAAATSALLDAHTLPAEQAAMLEIAMRLWHGSLDLSRHLGELPARMQGSLTALQKALARGPAGLDEWLDVEKR